MEQLEVIQHGAALEKVPSHPDPFLIKELKAKEDCARCPVQVVTPDLITSDGAWQTKLPLENKEFKLTRQERRPEGLFHVEPKRLESVRVLKTKYCHQKEDTNRHLRRMQRQMRLLDLRLQLLRERVHAARLQRMMAFHRCCLHLPEPWSLARRTLSARLDLERRMNSSRIQRPGRMLNSSHDRSHVALVDVKGFDPKDITVKVKDGKVMVLAEHREEHNTSVSKTRNYRKFMKEFNLPPGVSEDEVTYSLGPNSIVRIEAAPKGCSQLMNY